MSIFILSFEKIIESDSPSIEFPDKYVLLSPSTHSIVIMLHQNDFVVNLSKQ